MPDRHLEKCATPEWRAAAARDLDAYLAARGVRDHIRERCVALVKTATLERLGHVLVVDVGDGHPPFVDFHPSTLASPRRGVSVYDALVIRAAKQARLIGD